MNDDNNVSKDLLKDLGDLTIFISSLRTQGHMTLKTTEEWETLEALHNRACATVARAREKEWRR